ncbi:MAG: anti-sigma factor family protein [Elusimicrobiota bacterium]
MKEHIEGIEISALLDGALAASDRARVDAHVAACDSCRRELDALRHLKLVLSSAPRRTMPADLALSLESRFVTGTPWWKAVAKPALWIPAGAVAATALAVGIWANKMRAADELPFEPLLAAHERYSAEALVPEDNLVAANYSDQMTTLYADASDSEPQ